MKITKRTLSVLIVFVAILAIMVQGISAKAYGWASLNYSSITLFPGQSLQLSLNANSIDIKSVTYESDSSYVTVTNDGLVQTSSVEGLNSYSATITATYTYEDYGEIETDSTTCEIYVEAPNEYDLDLSSSVVAVGKKIKLSAPYNSYVNTTGKWSVEPASRATISQTGYITGKKAGEVTVSYTFTSGEASYQLQSKMMVTNPKFVKKKIAISKECYSANLSSFLKDTSEYSKITNVKSSNKKIVKIDKYNGWLYPLKSGKTVTISCKVDGKPLSVKVYITKPQIKNSYKNNVTKAVNPKPLFLKKGQKTSIKLKGTQKFSIVTYESSNEKVATVSAKGVVKAKKEGSATITVIADQAYYYVDVIVADAKVVKVLNRASDALGAQYSQAVRMNKGYYDCSSLVWRCYSPSGVNFGMNSWAPTAAAEAQSMYQQGKIIAHKGLAPSKLKPGDVVFTGTKYGVGNYAGVNHAALYIGGNMIIHASASNNSVCVISYDWLRYQTVAIARPFKSGK